jgi:3-hydroxyisobutyrate dehydrogenase-like beta-hydroxyacid dehydrogenase
MRVGFIGLGSQGGPMARRILEVTSSMGFTAAPLAAHAGALLQKDVGIAAEVAAAAAVDLGVLLAAADAALAVMEHPRRSAGGR